MAGLISGDKLTALQVIKLNGEGSYLSGKTALVTGGNSGIGLETCKALASAGAKVILCSRSIKAAETAIKEEIESEGHGNYKVDSTNIAVKALDLNSLTSVKALADDILKSGEKLDFLILNAGIMACPTLERTEDGFEKQIGVNHFGQAYLVRLLLGAMNKETPSRVVILASSAHDRGDPDPKDFNYTKGRSYSGWAAYGQSKGVNMIYARALANKLKDSNITAVSVHPGIIQTALWRQSFFNRMLGYLVTNKTIPQGAATTVWALVCPRIGTQGLRGKYLADCSECMVISKTIQDKDGSLEQATWEATEKDLNEALQRKGLPALPSKLL